MGNSTSTAGFDRILALLSEAAERDLAGAVDVETMREQFLAG